MVSLLMSFHHLTTDGESRKRGRFVITREVDGRYDLCEAKQGVEYDVKA